MKEHEKSPNLILLAGLLMLMDHDIVHHLKLAQSGDVEAFGYVATAFQARVLAWAKYYGGGEDAAQEALLAAWRGIADLREPEALPAWLRAITRTCALRQHRRRPDTLDAPEPEAHMPDEVVEAEVRGAVRGAVKELAPGMQMVIERHYMRGEKIEEIARATGLPQGTVKRRLHEAREKLRGRLSGLGGADTWR
jgi:RNA polymerase sigma factor (sigma-70 family)